MRTALVAPLVGGVACMALSAPASAQHQPVNEGGDYRRCVTYDEFNAWHLHMPEHRVQRIFDTKGRRVPARSLNAILGAVSHESVDSHNIVRAYRVCPEDNSWPTGRVLIEFNTRTPRHRSVSGSSA